MKEKIDEYWIEMWRNQESSGSLRRNYEQLKVDKKKTSNWWKKFNIKRSAYVQVVRMQENTTMNGNKLSQITGNNQLKYCRFCQNKIATANHILLSCNMTKRKQIEKHDYLASFIYRELERIGGFDKSVEIMNYKTRDNVQLFWNKNILPISTGKYPKRPDCCLIEDNRCIIIDVAIVMDQNLNKVFNNKITKYKTLIMEMRKIYKKRKYKIIPVIMSTNGLIHEESVKQLSICEINIPWEIITRNIVVRNMQDIMFYNGQNMYDEEEWNEWVKQMITLNSNEKK